MYNSVAGPEIGFEVDSYLQQRQEDDSFVMVEIGHGANPVAHKQPFDFVDGRAYIGIEAWMRYPESRFKQQEVYKDRTGENIFFVSQDLGGKVKKPFPEESSYTYYEGDFNAMTLLPDEAADEVFASNVFCDPLIAFHEQRVSQLLGEVTRIAAKSGMIVLREVTTPHYSKDVPKRDFVNKFGLEREAIVTPTDKESWAQLENIYQPGIGIQPQVGSHYLFLSKT